MHPESYNSERSMPNFCYCYTSISIIATILRILYGNCFVFEMNIILILVMLITLTEHPKVIKLSIFTIVSEGFSSPLRTNYS